METITIRASGENVNVIIDGTVIRAPHSFSIDYVRGAPVLFSCVTDLGTEKKETLH